jgi:hypothetical protein
MSILTSPPDGLAQLGWKRIVLTALAFALAPAVLGLAALVVVRVLGAGLQSEMAATLAAISPLVGLPAWATMATGAWWLLRRGSFGWLPAALLGLLPAAVLMRAGLGPLILPAGIAAALIYRMALALQRPDAI